MFSALRLGKKLNRFSFAVNIIFEVTKEAPWPDCAKDRKRNAIVP